MKQGGFGVRVRIALLAAAASVCAFPASALAAPNETKLVSRADGETIGGDADGEKQDGTFVDGPAISANGRFVAFSTNAGNLPTGTPGPLTVEQVYLRDTEENTIEHVSVATSGNPNGSSLNPSVSADGRFVAFESTASNLVAGDSNGASDVFRRDMQTDTTILASRSGGGDIGDGFSFDPSISADGRFVAFETDATNIGVNDMNGVTDVYVRDDGDGQTWSISLSTANIRGNGESLNPSISADGLRVAFDSEADNLASGDTDADADVFMREREADGQDGTTSLVSRADGAAGIAGNGQSFDPSLSSDGQHVAFTSSAFNLDLGDTIGGLDVYKRDLQATETSLVSRESGAAGDVGDSLSGKASISGDGRFVAFESRAENLSSDDLNTVEGDPVTVLVDLFLRDTRTSDTIFLSTGVSGAADGPSFRPSISGDGRVTAFYTTGTNLDGLIADIDDTTDVYTREADVDIVGPVAQITSSPATRTADNTATVGFNSAAPDLAGFECSIDGAAFAACPGNSITTPALADGAHEVRVRAFDAVANRGNPVAVAFVVDTTGPTTRIDSAPPATITSNTATIAFSSPDADSILFHCSIDGGLQGDCASPFSIPNLADGAHTVDVNAIDNLGNVGAAQRVAFTVDTPDSDPPGGDPDPPAKPYNDFSFGKAALNAKKGSATLPVAVPGAGKLELEGKGVKPAAGNASRASTVELPVKATGDLKKALKKKGKATAKVEVTFTPTGGDPNTEQTSVKLKLKK